MPKSNIRTSKAHSILPSKHIIHFKESNKSQSHHINRRIGAYSAYYFLCCVLRNRFKYEASIIYAFLNEMNRMKFLELIGLYANELEYEEITASAKTFFKQNFTLNILNEMDYAYNNI